MTSIFKKKDGQEKREKAKKTEIKPDQAKAVKRLIENLKELDEEELIAFIENDPELSKLPLKKRYEILESAKEYQQKLENPESADTEYKEQKEQEGRDPEQFLNEVFDWIDANRSCNDRSHWSWDIGKTESKFQYIDMQLNRASEFPTSFINKKEEISNFVSDLNERGIERLLKELQGKKVISINSKGRWYLEIV